MQPPRPISLILQTPAAPAPDARDHFAAKLSFETDPSDVNYDLTNRKSGFVVVDARSRDAHSDLHVPGAISLPHGTISAGTTAALQGQGIIVVYCWSASCNGATRAAIRLASLGFQVKEMIGGLEAWVAEGYATEGALAKDVSFAEYLRHHHHAPTGPFSRDR